MKQEKDSSSTSCISDERMPLSKNDVHSPFYINFYEKNITKKRTVQGEGSCQSFQQKWHSLSSSSQFCWLEVTFSFFLWWNSSLEYDGVLQYSKIPSSLRFTSKLQPWWQRNRYNWYWLWIRRSSICLVPSFPWKANLRTVDKIDDSKLCMLKNTRLPYVAWTTIQQHQCGSYKHNEISMRLSSQRQLIKDICVFSRSALQKQNFQEKNYQYWLFVIICISSETKGKDLLRYWCLVASLMAFETPQGSFYVWGGQWERWWVCEGDAWRDRGGEEGGTRGEGQILGGISESWTWLIFHHTLI